MTESITKGQRGRKRENTTDEHRGSESVCSSLRGTIPAGAPPCSSSGLTLTGFLHPDPASLAFVGQAVIERTDNGGE